MGPTGRSNADALFGDDGRADGFFRAVAAREPGLDDGETMLNRTHRGPH